jgi:hypothetical protein
MMIIEAANTPVVTYADTWWKCAVGRSRYDKRPERFLIIFPTIGVNTIPAK